MAHTDILNEREGWGRNVTGGAAGPLVTVDNLDDLTAALLAPGPAWISVTAPTGAWVTEKLEFTSDKTLDMRGSAVTFIGKSTTLFKMDYANNVIVLNAKLDGNVENWNQDSEGMDGINVRGCDGFWFHHCDFRRTNDGLIDLKDAVKNGSVTWCRFRECYQAMLWMGVGVTMAHCWSNNVKRRMPKSVGGKVHSYNNLIEKWDRPEIECAKDKGELLSEWNLWTPGITKVGLVENGGKIKSANHKSLGSTITFLNSGTLSDSFVSTSRATAKIKKPKDNAAWLAMRDELKAKCGATLLPLVA